MNYIIIPGLIDRKGISNPIKFFTAERILTSVSEYFNISVEQILTKTNKREVVYPRQIAMYILRTHSRLSLREIKQQVTLQNHASPIYAIRRLKDLMFSDERIKRDIDEIIQNL